MAKAKRVSAIVGATAGAWLIATLPALEGRVLRGYRDPVGIVTACSGHTKTAVLGRPYTPDECDELLDEDTVKHAEGVMACIGYDVETTPGERAAYVSFGFNVGVGRFCRTAIPAKLRAGDHRGACAELSRYVYAGKRELPGLVKRRRLERTVCERGLPT
jgi:lysozyme